LVATVLLTSPPCRALHPPGCAGDARESGPQPLSIERETVRRGCRIRLVKLEAHSVTDAHEGMAPRASGSHLGTNLAGRPVSIGDLRLVTPALSQLS
jgi:hypothetical protein